MLKLEGEMIWYYFYEPQDTRRGVKKGSQMWWYSVKKGTLYGFFFKPTLNLLWLSHDWAVVSALQCLKKWFFSFFPVQIIIYLEVKPNWCGFRQDFLFVMSVYLFAFSDHVKATWPVRDRPFNLQVMVFCFVQKKKIMIQSFCHIT